MAIPAKIESRYRRMREISDTTEIVEILFPGNSNQQHAVAGYFWSSSGPTA